MLACILLTPSVMTVSRGTGVDCFSLMPSLLRHCEEPTGRANARPMTGSATKQSSLVCGDGLLRGACHRAALCADPLARNDEGPNYGFSGADNCSVRSRSVMSTTVSIGAVSSYT